MTVVSASSIDENVFIYPLSISLIATLLIIYTRHKNHELKRYKKMNIELNESNVTLNSFAINNIKVNEIQSPFFLSERQHLLNQPLPVRVRNNESHLLIRSIVQAEGS